MGTWSDVAATGIGGDGVEFRLVIEGAPYEVCTSEEMAGDVVNDASLLPAPGAVTWTNVASVTITTGQTDPEGGTDAVLLTGTDAAGEDLVRTDNGTYAGPLATRCEIYVKRDAAATNFVGLEVRASGTGSGFVAGGVYLHLSTGEVQTYGTGYSDATCVLEGDWWRVRFSNSGLAGTTLAMRVRPSVGFAASYPADDVTATGDATVYAPIIRAADGRRRISGLKREGLGFSESAYLAGAELSVSVNPVRMDETAGPTDLDALTSMFTAQAAEVDWLDATLSTAATSATVKSGAGVTDEEHYHLGTEVVKVTNISGTTLTIERGKWRTTAQRHPVTDATGTPQLRAVRDGISIWTGRRVWLYAHGRDELDTLDGGTIVWRGVVAGEPQLEGSDATTWVLNIDSRWRLTEQEVGTGDGDGRQIKGIYYSDYHAFKVSLVRWATDNIAESAGGASPHHDDPIKVVIVGFFATQQAFMDELVMTIQTATDAESWGVTWGALEVNGQWELLVTMPGASPRYISVFGGSIADGWGTGLLGSETSAGMPPRFDGEWKQEITASSTYYTGWSDAYPDESIGSDRPTDAAHHRPLDPLDPTQLRRVPRSLNTVFRLFDSGGTAPSARLYLSDISGLDSGDVVILDAGDDEPRVRCTISSVDTTDGYIEAYYGSSIENPIPFAGVGTDVPKILAAPTYGSAEAGTTLEGFRTALLSAATESANEAATPWITSDDVASWSTVVTEAANGRPYLTKRVYSFYQGVRLDEVLRQEARLYGLFFYLDADFKIAVRPLTLDSQEPAAALSDEDGTIITAGGFGELTSGHDGNVNVVQIHRGYDPVDDKYLGGMIEVRTVAAISEAKTRRVLEIKPKVGLANGVEDITASTNGGQAHELTAPVRALFGGKIHYYTVQVTLQHFDVLVGDTVTLSSQALPYRSGRAANTSSGGMRNARALVVGREWDLSEGTGRLTCLVTGIDVFGYAPSARVASVSGAGTTWTLTIEQNRYAPTGSFDVDYFAVGDEIRLVEWDSDAPTVRYGTITDIDAYDIDVTLTASWAGPSGATYNIGLSTSADVSAARRAQFLFIAGSDLRIDDGGTEMPARKFAP